jgi:hypothetical protein
MEDLLEIIYTLMKRPKKDGAHINIVQQPLEQEPPTTSCVRTWPKEYLE